MIPIFHFFITNTQVDKIPQNVDLFYSFSNDMKYDLNYGDKKSSRYVLFKVLFNQYLQQQQFQSGSALNYVFLPSDPDELVDQLKLIYFEKIGGNDNPMLNEQIVATVDKLLNMNVLQKMNIKTSGNILKGSDSGTKILFSGLDSLHILYLYPCLSSNLFINKELYFSAHAFLHKFLNSS